MTFHNPTRDFLRFTGVEQFVSLTYRFHVNYVGSMHVVFSFFLPRVVWVKLDHSSTHAKGAAVAVAHRQVEEDRAARFA